MVAPVELPAPHPSLLKKRVPLLVPRLDIFPSVISGKGKNTFQNGRLIFLSFIRREPERSIKLLWLHFRSPTSFDRPPPPSLSLSCQPEAFFNHHHHLFQVHFLNHLYALPRSLIRPRAVKRKTAVVTRELLYVSTSLSLSLARS